MKSTERKKRSALDHVARVVRGITVPPVLIAALLIIQYGLNTGVFTSLAELLVSLLGLMLIPFAAYPVSYVVPRLRKKGREAQRKLAFVFSLLGYTAALLYGLLAQVSEALLTIFLAYFFSILMLILCNKVLKIRSSGHACGITGPLIFFVYFTGLWGLIPCVVIAVGVVWSSVRLRRHTVPELALGAVTALVGFLVALVIISVF